MQEAPDIIQKGHSFDFVLVLILTMFRDVPEDVLASGGVMLSADIEMNANNFFHL